MLKLNSCYKTKDICLSDSKQKLPLIDPGEIVFMLSFVKDDKNTHKEQLYTSVLLTKYGIGTFEKVLKSDFVLIE